MIESEREGLLITGIVDAQFFVAGVSSAFGFQVRSNGTFFIRSQYETEDLFACPKFEGFYNRWFWKIYVHRRIETR